MDAGALMSVPPKKMIESIRSCTKMVSLMTTRMSTTVSIQTFKRPRRSLKNSKTTLRRKSTLMTASKRMKTKMKTQKNKMARNQKSSRKKLRSRL
jgi:hypothetical protein